MAENTGHTDPVSAVDWRSLWLDWAVAVSSTPQPKGLDTGDDLCCTDICRSRSTEHVCYFHLYAYGLRFFTFQRVVPGTHTQRETSMKDARDAGWQRVCVVDDYRVGPDGVVEGFRVLGLPPA